MGAASSFFSAAAAADVEKGSPQGPLSTKRGSNDSDAISAGAGTASPFALPRWSATDPCPRPGCWKRWTQRKEPPAVDSPPGKLSWPKLTICLIVEAIALGTLGMPAAFASMGMILGLGSSLFFGVLAVYTALVVGEVKVLFPRVRHYADAVGLICGRLGYEIAGVMFVALLCLLLGSHTLTGTIAFDRLFESMDICSVAFGAVSALLLFLLALPPSFAEFAWLGYIDFASVIIAVGMTTIVAGIRAYDLRGRDDVTTWTWGPPSDATFQSAFLGATNIIFAYTFAVAMFSFMSEMKDPAEYKKAVETLGIVQTTIYTATGAMLYVWLGEDVESPVLLSAAPKLMSKIVFGLALPVIFISGSINANVVGTYIIDRWAHSWRTMSRKQFWCRWSGLIGVLTILSWIVASAIPFFGALLGLISSLFTSGFTFYFPALFWFKLIKKGRWNATPKNIMLSVLNVVIFLIGLLLLVGGTYVSVWEISQSYARGEVGGPFSCASSLYKEQFNATEPLR